MKYEEIRAQLNTCDLVLFSGKGAVSGAIKWFTRSRWSHVGMVLRLPLNLDTVLIWESTIDGDGVGLSLLSDRTAKYDGDIAIRQIQNYDFPAGFYRDLTELRHALRGRPYERSRLELLRSAYDGPGGFNEPDLSSLFCSELVAAAYQKLGILTLDPPANEYTPRDFAHDELPLLGGVKLSELTFLERG